MPSFWFNLRKNFIWRFYKVPKHKIQFLSSFLDIFLKMLLRRLWSISNGSLTKGDWHEIVLLAPIFPQSLLNTNLSSNLIQVRRVLNFNFTQVANQFWDQIFEHFSKRRELIVERYSKYIEDYTATWSSKKWNLLKRMLMLDGGGIVGMGLGQNLSGQRMSGRVRSSFSRIQRGWEGSSSSSFQKSGWARNQLKHFEYCGKEASKFQCFLLLSNQRLIYMKENQKKIGKNSYFMDAWRWLYKPNFTSGRVEL